MIGNTGESKPASNFPMDKESTCFWMLPTDWVYGGWAASGEIDIMELVGHEQMLFTGHYTMADRGTKTLTLEFLQHWRTICQRLSSLCSRVGKWRNPMVCRWCPLSNTNQLVPTAGVVCPIQSAISRCSTCSSGWELVYPDASTVFPQRMEVIMSVSTLT